MLGLGFWSCQKEIVQTIAGPADMDVYVAGFVVADQGKIPAYWKNGRLVLLDSAKYYNANFYQTAGANSIAVSGNDVYVAGYLTGYTANRLGAYWKNGVGGDVGSSYQELTSLAILNNDFYMVGFRSSIWGTGDPATYYKNGSRVDITDGSAGSDAVALAISGNDVYMAGVSITGNVSDGNQHLMAKYWKNGNPVNLTDGTKWSEASSIAVSGADVYVAGVEDNGGAFFVCKYWKNGVPVNLTDGTTDADVTSIAVSGSDVYVAGRESDVAKYWKNGNPVNLTDGTKWATATSITVSGNDVYVAGHETTAVGTEDFVAKYWKDGKPVSLVDVSKYSTSEAHGIFLVKK